jgi:hypothetical protein
MPNKNILDFVAALASNQPAAAVDFAKAELLARRDAAVSDYAANHSFKLEGSTHGQATTAD